MPLTPGSKSEQLALEVLTLDPEVVPRLKGTIRLGKKNYEIQFYEDGKQVGMSLASFIMDRPAGQGFYWSHRNGDETDYRMVNLELLPRKGNPAREEGNKRIAEAGRQRRIEQARVDGKFIGVMQMKGGKFYARFKLPGTKKIIYPGGGFHDPADAARAYDQARIEHGLEAVNFP